MQDEQETIEIKIDPIDDMMKQRDTPKDLVAEDLEEHHKPETKTKDIEKDNIGKDNKESLKKQKSEDTDQQGLKDELEKTKQQVIDNQKYGRQKAQQVKNLKRSIKQLTESGNISDLEAEPLLKILENDDVDEDEQPVFANTPLVDIFKIARAELPNIRKYNDEDAEFDDKVNAFDYFIQLGDREEVEETVKELESLKGDPTKLTKRMLAIGKKYYEEDYREIKQAGGVAPYIQEMKNEKVKLNKEIDKLKQKLSQYTNDYDEKSSYKLESLNESASGSEHSKDPIDDMMKRRDSPRGQRKHAA